MPIVVTMPKLTDSMEEGHIVEWKVRVGDRVQEGDVLAEIETDKAVMELESFWAGTVGEILRESGDIVPVGEVIARIAETGDEVGTGPAEEAPAPAGAEVAAPSEKEEVALAPPGAPAPETVPTPEAVAPSRAERAPEQAPATEPGIPVPGGRPAPEKGTAAPTSPPARGVAARPSGGVQASPRARKLARKKGVEIAHLQGTGPGGRVRTEDVEAAALGSEAVGPPSEGKPAEAEREKDMRVRVEPAARVLAESRGVELGTVTGTGLDGRITVADVLGAVPKAAPTGQPEPSRPERADEELPRVTFSPEEAEVEEVSFYQKAAIRRVVASKHVIPHFYVTKTVRADAVLGRKEAEQEMIGATLTHYIMRACAIALIKFPEANRSYDRGHWIRWRAIHLGLAVQTDAGLVVAVLRDVGDKGVSWIAEQARGLVARARRGKLTPPERTNPTFTISNLGAYDVESFSAIINPPSSLTLAVGSVVPTPVATEGEVEVANVMHLTLSCDHRVVDGVLAARFLGEVKALLEAPEHL